MKYSIEGAPLPVVICDLNAGETMITEKGGNVMDDSQYEDGDRGRWRRKDDWAHV